MSSLSSCLWLLWSITLNTSSPVGRIVVVLVWIFITASVIIVWTLHCQFALLKFTITHLVSNNSVVLMEGPLLWFDECMGMHSHHNLFGWLISYHSGGLLFVIQSLVFALMMFWMMVGIGYKCLVLFTHVAFCVWCFANEIWGMITMVSLGLNDNRTG